ncbi:barstar family protein [Dokdonella sp. MW10]|uniref:barstar family protein n=1 Tax=Dokdonella sp. MW10 TaxID=2992926 RepID=UPI003F7CDCEC
MKPIILIDGRAFSDLDGFFRHFGERALADREWGRNLDAFDDVLRGGFGTPEEGFVITWEHHRLSRQRLGFAETERVLRARLHACHSSGVAGITRDLERAQARQGPTVFDWLVEIIEAHGQGGPDAEYGVELVLA